MYKVSGVVRIDSDRNGTRAVVPRCLVRVASAATEADPLTVSQRTNRQSSGAANHPVRVKPSVHVHLESLIGFFIDGYRRPRSVHVVPRSSPLRTGVLTDTEANAVASWADTIQSWPVGSHVWGQ